MMPEMKIRLTGGQRIEADFNGNIIQTDQPVDEGGEGSAPSPFDLFLASLGTCAGFYVNSFCFQRGINVEGISLIMSMEQDEEKALVGKIMISIILPDEFPEKYINAVKKAAAQCTVKRTLADPPELRIRTVQKQGK